jgi:hypothetical protein
LESRLRALDFADLVSSGRRLIKARIDEIREWACDETAAASMAVAKQIERGKFRPISRPPMTERLVDRPERRE